MKNADWEVVQADGKTVTVKTGGAKTRVVMPQTPAQKPAADPFIPPAQPGKAKREAEALKRAAGLTPEDLLDLGQRPRAYTSAEVTGFVLTKKKYPQQIRVLVDAGLAAQLLKRVKKNRPVRLGHVQSLVRASKGEAWVLIHAGVAVDTQGNVYDGQHRLRAIVETGIPAELFIAVGMPVAAYNVTDGGLKRTLADHLDSAGEKNCNHLAGALRLLWLYQQEINGEDPRTATIEESLLLLAANPGLRDAITRAHTTAVRPTCYVTAIPLAVLCHLIDTEPGDAALGDQFMDGIHGAGATPNVAALNGFLRKAMRAGFKDPSRLRQGLTMREMLAFLILCWNAETLDVKMRLKWDRGAALPRFIGKGGQ